jgi:uncharacterized coiled-coil protein SlyX
MADDEEITENAEDVLDSEEEIEESEPEPEPEPRPEPEDDFGGPKGPAGAKSPMPLMILGIVVGLAIGLVVGMMLLGAEDLSDKVKDLEAQLDDVEANLADKDENITNLNEDIAANLAQINQLNGYINENNTALIDNISRLADADANITSLNENITIANNNIATLNDEVTDLLDENTDLINENEVLMMESNLRDPHILHLQSPFLDITCSDCHDVDSSGVVQIRDDYFYRESELTTNDFRRDVNAEECAKCHGPFLTETTLMTDDYISTTWLEEQGYTESCASASPCHSTWKTDMEGNVEADTVKTDHIENLITGEDIETITEVCLTCHGGLDWYMEGH